MFIWTTMEGAEARLHVQDTLAAPANPRNPESGRGLTYEECQRGQPHWARAGSGVRAVGKELAGSQASQRALAVYQ